MHMHCKLHTDNNIQGHDGNRMNWTSPSQQRNKDQSSHISEELSLSVEKRLILSGSNIKELTSGTHDSEQEIPK